MANTRITGITDKIKILDSTPAEYVPGFIVGGSYELNNASEPKGGVGEGVNRSFHIDGVASGKGKIKIECPDLKTLQLIGTYSAGWTVVNATTLPEYTVQMDTYTGKYISFTGCKFSLESLELTKGGLLTMTFGFVAKDYTYETGSISQTMETDTPLSYLSCKLKVAGSYVGSISRLNIGIDRGLHAERGIENASVASIRKPTDVLEKKTNISFSADIEITDDTAWTQVIGGTSIQDSRSDVAIIFETTSTGGSLTLTGARVEGGSFDKPYDEGEIRVGAISGTALSWSVAGS